MVCAPVGSIIPSLKLGDYLSLCTGAQTILYLSFVTDGITCRLYLCMWNMYIVHNEIP